MESSRPRIARLLLEHDIEVKKGGQCWCGCRLRGSKECVEVEDIERKSGLISELISGLISGRRLGPVAQSAKVRNK